MWYNYLFYNNNLWYLWVMTNLNLICWQYIWWVLLKVFSIWLTFNKLFLKCRQHSSLNPIWSKTCMKDKTHRIIFPSTLFVVWLLLWMWWYHDAISHICNKYFGRSAKCVNLPIWGVGFYFQYGGTMARQRGKPTMYTLPHPQYTASSAVPPVRVSVETCVENLLHGDACLLPVCRGGWAMSRLWVGLALQSTQKGINPDILPKDFPLPNKIWLLADFVKNVPQFDSRCIALPPNADRSHWRPRPMLAELLSQPGKLDENITKTSWDESILPKLGMLFA